MDERCEGCKHHPVCVREEQLANQVKQLHERVRGYPPLMPEPGPTCMPAPIPIPLSPLL
jgi:hypothetical protein